MAKTGALCAAEISAARAIEKAVFSILTGDIHATRFDRQCYATNAGARGSSFEDLFLGGHDLRRTYYDWIEQMAAHRIPAGPVLDVIIEGQALTEVDRCWKKRKGWTRGVLVRALGLFNEVLVRGEEKNRLTA